MSDGVDNVVDLHETADGLRGQGDGGGGDEKGLDNILFQDVGDHSLANVDACVHFPLSVPEINYGEVILRKDLNNEKSYSVGIQIPEYSSF